MFEIFRNAWRITEVRSKIRYTLLLLFIFRLGSYVPTPFVNAAAIGGAFDSSTMWGLMDMFNGGAVSNFTIFATGISPYITASIVLQLLTVAIPALERLQKEGGEEGRKKISQYTRYGAIILSLVQTGGILIGYRNTGIMIDTSWYAYVTVLIVQAAGAAFAMWLGERITEKGIGNGISLLIFINIIARLPVTFQAVTYSGGQFNFLGLLGVLLMALVIITAVVYIDLGQRRIPVQYAKRTVGRKVYGGQSTHIPMKMNNSGVLPLIFAMTMVSFPGMILMSFSNNESGLGNFARGYLTVMDSKSVLYIVILFLLIIFFTYFYSQISFNPVDIAKNIQQNGGFIPGIRPGRPTSDYLLRVSNRLNVFSALFLGLLALIPTLFLILTGLESPFGATSVLILVSVALETSKQLESQMLMRHYKGFM